jgi:hypothetical protein
MSDTSTTLTSATVRCSCCCDDPQVRWLVAVVSSRWRHRWLRKLSVLEIAALDLGRTEMLDALVGDDEEADDPTPTARMTVGPPN